MTQSIFNERWPFNY